MRRYSPAERSERRCFGEVRRALVGSVCGRSASMASDGARTLAEPTGGERAEGERWLAEHAER